MSHGIAAQAPHVRRWYGEIAGTGLFTVGSHSCSPDSPSVFAEGRNQHGKGPLGPTQTFDLAYASNDRRTCGAKLDAGNPARSSGWRSLRRALPPSPVYRHLGRHVKLGVGYNFTRFSDDLTDLGYRARGWFVNLIGKL